MFLKEIFQQKKQKLMFNFYSISGRDSDWRKIRGVNRSITIEPDFSLTVSSILILKDVLKSLKDRNESVRQGITRSPDTIRIINKMMLHEEWESRSSIESMQQRFQIRPHAEVLWFIGYRIHLRNCVSGNHHTVFLWWIGGISQKFNNRQRIEKNAELYKPYFISFKLAAFVLKERNEKSPLGDRWGRINSVGKAYYIKGTILSLPPQILGGFLRFRL